MSLGSWYVSRGRIDRPTFWLKYFLVLLAVQVAAGLLDYAFGFADFYTSTPTSETYAFSTTAGPIGLIVSLASLVPSISSSVTRLHDTGRSAWWLLIGLVPFAGIIVLIVFWCLPSQPHPNRYGPPTGRAQGFADPGYPQQGYGQQPPYGQQ